MEKESQTEARARKSGSLSLYRSVAREAGKVAKWNLGLAPKPMYTPLGLSISVVPDSMYPWPARDLKIIREFDPGFIPLFRQMVYRNTSTGGETIFRHFGVGRFEKTLRAPEDPGCRRILMPCTGYGSKWPRPNVIDIWFNGPVKEGSVRATQNLPPPFVPWGDWVCDWVISTYWEASAKEKAEFVEKHSEESLAAQARVKEEEETAYRQRGEASYQKRLVDSLGPEDEKEALARQQGYTDRTPKPFVEVRQSA